MLGLANWPHLENFVFYILRLNTTRFTLTDLLSDNIFIVLHFYLNSFYNFLLQIY